jgi:hypothetical protein
MSKFAKAISVILLASLPFLAMDAYAQRAVSVNGQHLNSRQLIVLDQLVGAYVPNGHYWLNMQTGAWGYVGNPVIQGYIGAGNYYGGGGSPGDAYSGQNYRGPFGDYMSDGRCSFVNGIPVGDC